MVRSEITHTLDSAYHMLRHFEQLPLRLEHDLLSKGHSTEDLETSLRSPGSRFASHFAQSIDELLDRLFSVSTYTLADGQNGNLQVYAVAAADKFPEGIGTCGVMEKSALSEQDKAKLYRKKNRDVSLWHLDVTELPRTGEFTLILKPANLHYIFITAFPGPPAMPLPEHTMPRALLEECRKFWQEHVFLNLFNPFL